MSTKQNGSQYSPAVIEALLKLRDRDLPSLKPHYYSVAEILEQLPDYSRSDVNNALACLKRSHDVVRDPNDYMDGIHWRLHEQAVANYKAEQKRLSRKAQATKLPPITRYYVSPKALKAGAPVDCLERDRVEVYTPSWESAA